MGRVALKKISGNWTALADWKNGRSEKIRTSDPHNPIVVRYQAAPRSETRCVF